MVDYPGVIIVGDRALMKKYSYLSNFYRCPVFYKDVLYDSSEAAFQAQKCKDRELVKSFSKGGEWSSPVNAKKYGNKVELIDDWDSIKDDVMYEVCLSKFKQNPLIARKLKRLVSDGYTVEEANGHGDTYWGTVDGVGENKLGIILTRIGRELVDLERS